MEIQCFSKIHTHLVLQNYMNPLLMYMKSAIVYAPVIQLFFDSADIWDLIIFGTVCTSSIMLANLHDPKDTWGLGACHSAFLLVLTPHPHIMFHRFIQHTSLHLTYPAPQSLSEIARIVVYLNVLSLNLHVPAVFLDYSVSQLDSPLFDRDRDGSLAFAICH